MDKEIAILISSRAQNQKEECLTNLSLDHKDFYSRK